MHAEHLVVHDCAEGQVVKDLGAVAPYVDTAILAQTLIVKAVHLRDLPRFVVATDQGDAVGVANLRKRRRGNNITHNSNGANSNSTSWASGKRISNSSYQQQAICSPPRLQAQSG